MRYNSAIIFIFLLMTIESKAQLFSKRDIAIHQGFITFHNLILNNKNNNNKKTSQVTELDKNLFLTKYSSFNTGLGMGNYKNLDNRFAAFESCNFFRIKAGLMLHLPQNYSAHNLTPKFFNPFIKVAYNFDISDRHFENLGGNRMSSSLRLGGGFVFRLTHHIGLMYEASHNQRVAPDYRSFFQHTFGIIINMEEPHKAF